MGRYTIKQNMCVSTAMQTAMGQLSRARHGVGGRLGVGVQSEEQIPVLVVPNVMVNRCPMLICFLHTVR